MNTLKQLIIKNYMFYPNTKFPEQDTEIIINITKKWLTQKFETQPQIILKIKYGIENITEKTISLQPNPRHQLLNELLKELNEP